MKIFYYIRRFRTSTLLSNKVSPLYRTMGSGVNKFMKRRYLVENDTDLMHLAFIIVLGAIHWSDSMERILFRDSVFYLRYMCDMQGVETGCVKRI